MKLLPMTDAEYADFAQRQLVEYARQHVRSGDWPEAEAIERSRAAAKDLLADTLRSRGHDFLKAVDAAGDVIGWLWIAPAPEFVHEPHETKRWLAQITVAESHRGKGNGRALLNALHDRLRSDGIEEIWLRVFDWNIVAKQLYETAGYERVNRFQTDEHLRKHL